MDLKLKDILDACEEMGLCLVLKYCDNYYYAHSKNITCWLVHFVGSGDERCGGLEISTEWQNIDGEFIPVLPRWVENISKEQLKQEIREMLIQLKKAIVQKKKNDIEQDFLKHTYTITVI